jgi:hypothetical protein
MASFTLSSAERAFVDGLTELVTRAASRASAAAPTLQQVDAESLQSLRMMGFDAERGSLALAMCEGKLERSVQWLVEHDSVPIDELARRAAAAGHCGSASEDETGARQARRHTCVAPCNTLCNA